MNIVPPLSPEPLAALAGVLPDGALLTRDEDLARYSRDWSGDHAGRPLAVARPSSVEEMSALLAGCHKARIPMVPQGGLTGLVGAAVAADGRELVISLERMNRIRSVDPIDFAIVVEAGCILEDAKRAAEARTACYRSPSAHREAAASAATSPPMPAASTCCATA